MGFDGGAFGEKGKAGRCGGRGAPKHLKPHSLAGANRANTALPMGQHKRIGPSGRTGRKDEDK